jgi:hypothetical protein
MLRILLHGRIDLKDRHHRVVATVDASMAPPLGHLPVAGAPPQRFTAVAAEACYVLEGGPHATEALLRIITAQPGEHGANEGDVELSAAAPATNAPKAIGEDASCRPVRHASAHHGAPGPFPTGEEGSSMPVTPGKGLLHALALLKEKHRPSAREEHDVSPWVTSVTLGDQNR